MSVRAEFWVKLLEKHGFPAMFGCVLLAMFATGAQWVGREVFIPMRDAQVRLMQKLGDASEQQAAAIRNVESMMGEMNDNQRQAAQGIEDMKSSLDRASRALERLGKYPQE